MPILPTRSSLPPFDEYAEAIRPLWDSRWLTNMGVNYAKLINALRAFLKADNLSLFVNGHIALEAALAVLKLTGEVITTPFTFASTTQAIVRAGLTPVFCDIDPVTYTLDPNKLEALITERTSAIMPVHVYGNLCDWKRIDAIGHKHGLKVIYDAAHAFGMEQDGAGVACFGDVTMFSFHATKVYHTIEGGALAYRDAALNKLLASWCEFGLLDKEDAVCVGTNAKLNEFAAAMGLCNLRYIDVEIERRKQVAMRYRERLCGQKGVILCEEQPGIRYNYAYLPVRFILDRFGMTRDAVIERLARQDIYARRYFYPLTSAFSVYRNMFPIQATPVAQITASEIMTLPLYADLDTQSVDHICDIILGCEDS